MSGNPQIPTGTAFAWRLAVFYAALFVVLGVQLPFLPLWLAAKGLNAGEIGIVLAVPAVVRVFAIPAATRTADRRNALRGAIVAAGCAAAASYAALGLASGFLAIVAVFAVAAAFYAPIMPLADAYALRGLRERSRAYGPVRLWGSAAFIAGSFAAGLMLDVLARTDLIWLVVLTVALTALAAMALVPLAAHAERSARPVASAGKLLRNPAFLAIAAGASLVQASHALVYGFSALDWQAAGLGGGTIAALWAIGVLAEIVLFAVSGRLSLNATALLLVGAAAATVRWLGMALNPPMVLLPVLQCLHGLSFGATHLGTLAFLARAAPVEIAATAQGTMAVVQGLAMAGAMGMSGLLYARYGTQAYGAMALMAAAGGLCVLASPSAPRRNAAQT